MKSGQRDNSNASQKRTVPNPRVNMTDTKYKSKLHSYTQGGNLSTAKNKTPRKKSGSNSRGRRESSSTPSHSTYTPYQNHSSAEIYENDMSTIKKVLVNQNDSLVSQK